MKKSTKKIIKKMGVIVFWLILWEILSLIIANPILFASPVQTVGVLFKIITTDNYGNLLLVIATSMGRILLGLLLGIVIGTMLAIASNKNELLCSILEPFVLCTKAVPIASFVVLLLIWYGSKWLSLGISFLIVFPIFYTNVLEGLKYILDESVMAAKVFNYSWWDRIWWIYRIQMRGYAESATKLSVSMCIKAGVAAEIIGLPSGSFGEKLYMAKIYFSTDELFAWTIIIVLVAFVTEKILLVAERWIMTVKVSIHGAKDKETLNEPMIVLENLSKAYGDKRVINDFNLKANAGDIIGIMAPSGTGKTTLFSIMTGIKKADSGNVKMKGKISAVFQEPLLCEELNGYDNVRLASTKGKDIIQKLLTRDEAHKKVKNYSLGMKRRCSIARALAIDYDILLLDEPFASLDEDNRNRAIELVREYSNNRIVIIFTHNEEEIASLGGRKITLPNLL